MVTLIARFIVCMGYSMYGYGLWIDLIRKWHNAPVPYPTMHRWNQKCVHFGFEWCVCAIWDRCIAWCVPQVSYSWWWCFIHFEQKKWPPISLPTLSNTLNWWLRILTQISLKFIPKGQLIMRHHGSANRLVPNRRQAFKSESRMTLSTDAFIFRHQCVKCVNIGSKPWIMVEFNSTITLKIPFLTKNLLRHI